MQKDVKKRVDHNHEPAIVNTIMNANFKKNVMIQPREKERNTHVIQLSKI